MAVTDQTLQMYRGERAVPIFTGSGSPALTGKTVLFTVAKKANSATKLIGPIQATVTSATSCYLLITEAMTEPMKPGSYFFDLWIDDTREVIATGVYELDPDARFPVAA